MKKTRLSKFVLFIVALLSPYLGMSAATFVDFALNLENGNFLTAEEIENKTTVSFGVAIGSDSSQTRVDATDANANVVLKNFKYHNDEHGFNPGEFVVAVTGPVKITYGTCNWGGDVTVKDAEGNTVASFNTNNGKCYHLDRENNMVSAFYNGAATTLTCSGGSYIPYFAVKAVDASEVPSTVKVVFADGGFATEEINIGEKITLPFNRLIYNEGKTMSGWTDGTNSYSCGEEITVTKDITLSSVFADNTVNLGDRKTEVIAKWDFQRKNGAPLLSLQGGGITGKYVTQASVDGTTIDVAINYDVTNGKIANGNWNDWAQFNGGTIFTVPVVNGSIISMEAYSTITTTTIDGETSYAQGNTISYEYSGDAKDLQIVIGDGSYYRYIQVTYPYIEPNHSGEEVAGDVSAIWDFNLGASNPTEAVVNLENAFSITGYEIGSNLSISGTATIDETRVLSKLKCATSADGTAASSVSFNVTPSSGLTFTAKHIDFWSCRTGTDGGQMNIMYSIDNGEEVALATGVTPCRNNSTGKLESDTAHMTHYVFDLGSVAVEGGKNFKLIVYLNGVGANKEYAFSDVVISGTSSGTLADVTKYSLTTSVSPAEAGSISVKPKSEIFEEGTEITLTTTKNFGYKFVKWTNAAGETLSTETSYVFNINADQEITAVYEPLATYELTVDVDGGANSYMVSCNPEYTLVNGKKMYEEGTTVTLTASSNPILTFTNWSDGTTGAEMSFVMSGDKSVLASYSSVEFIVGWDFILSGNNGRPADFYSVGNSATTLILRNAEGTTQSWLDKSEYSAGGYEGQPAAVNWQSPDNYYYQTVVDASNFTDIIVSCDMLYNYNAHTIQSVEYSLDGTNFTTAGTITIPGVKVWQHGDIQLPTECNNKSKLYIRWIPDYTSAIDGTTSGNDGTSISNIFITGTDSIINPGVPPVLTSTIPTTGATGASATGKIVLSFDRRITIADGAMGSIGNSTITPTVTGKVITLNYIGLDYGTEYTFVMPKNTISDLSGNFITEDIAIKFTTMTRPTVTKRNFDAVVSTAEELKDALTKASANTTGERFYILVKNGEYYLGSEITSITANNVSLIGQSYDKVLIYNQSIEEGIGVTATFRIESSATGFYAQDMKWQNKYPYLNTTGRAVVLQDRGNKNIYKNIALLSYQDTYYSNNNSARFYFEDCEIHGVVDFICGGGDVYFNRTRLVLENRNGNCITAPATSSSWGYVFNDCTIDPVDEEARSVVNGTYSLGRPWQGSPRAVYINTKMNVIPTSAGWSEMGAVPGLFAEYNSVNAQGETIDCSNRKTEFASTAVSYNPVLTADEAAKFTISNVLGGNDSWVPQLATEQVEAPKVTISGNTLSWNDNDYALCFVVCADDEIVDITTGTTYTIPSDSKAASYTVFAANSYGGLGEGGSIATSIKKISESSIAIKGIANNISISGVKMNSNVEIFNYGGQLLKRSAIAEDSEINMPAGIYIVRVSNGMQQAINKVVVR